MFTVCPKCTLTLVVTTVDLRAGQGYVRCGRCANVFNALIALREGDPNAAKLPPSRPPAEPAMGAGVSFEPEPEPAPEPEPQSEPEAAPEPVLGSEPEAEPQAEPAPEPEFLAEPPPEVVLDPEPSVDQPAPAEIELNLDAPTSDDQSMEFDDTATDVSEIFIAPPQAEHDTTSGSYEEVVLAEEPQQEPPVFAEPEPEIEQPSHADTVAPGEWSLLDDDPPADSESVIEESPFAQEPEPEPAQEAEPEATQEAPVGDPTWVQEMFEEAEAQAMHSRTAEQRALQTPFEESAADEVDETSEEPAVVRAARDVKGLSAASGDTVLEPLLEDRPPGRPRWQYVAGIVALCVVLVLQILNHNRQSLVLSPAFGPVASTVYGWFGVSVTPRWDLNAYTVKQLGAEAEGGEGTRLRVRLSVQNDSDRVQPLPLLRLTLQDRYGNAVATRDLEPREYLPPRAAGQRLLEPDQRIDAELHVIDPGRAAIGFEIDACLRGDSGNIGCANDARRRAAG